MLAATTVSNDTDIKVLQVFGNQIWAGPRWLVPRGNRRSVRRTSIVRASDRDHCLPCDNNADWNAHLSIFLDETALAGSFQRAAHSSRRFH
jgi:hypothetical protein